MPRPRAPERAAGPKVADPLHRDYTRETLRLKEPVAFFENPIGQRLWKSRPMSQTESILRLERIVKNVQKQLSAETTECKCADEKQKVIRTKEHALKAALQKRVASTKHFLWRRGNWMPPTRI
jgi:hypothetical protein